MPTDPLWFYGEPHIGKVLEPVDARFPFFRRRYHGVKRDLSFGVDLVELVGRRAVFIGGPTEFYVILFVDAQGFESADKKSCFLLRQCVGVAGQYVKWNFKRCCDVAAVFYQQVGSDDIACGYLLNIAAGDVAGEGYERVLFESCSLRVKRGSSVR